MWFDWSPPSLDQQHRDQHQHQHQHELNINTNGIGNVNGDHHHRPLPLYSDSTSIRNINHDRQDSIASCLSFDEVVVDNENNNPAATRAEALRLSTQKEEEEEEEAAAYIGAVAAAAATTATATATAHTADYCSTNNNYQARQAVTALDTSTSTSASAASPSTLSDEKDEKEDEEGQVEDLTDMIYQLLLDNESNTNNDVDVEEEGPIISKINKQITTKVDKVWYEEMYNMNHKQREQCNDELHCVQTRYKANNIEETPQLIQSSLMEMNTIIENDSIISRQTKQAHTYATTTLCNCHTNTKQGGSNCKCYVRSEYFRIRFLRTELFNPHKAAIRYCKNLNLIYRYFGDVSLQRQLYLTDLTRDEIKFIKQGEKQVLSCRDKLGRRIYWTLGLNWNIRIDLYFLYGVMAEDITTQQNGSICVMMFNGSEQSQSQSQSESQSQTSQSQSNNSNSNSNSNSNNNTSGSNDDGSSDDRDAPITGNVAFSSSSSTKLSTSSQIKTTATATHRPPAQILQEGNQNVYQEMLEAAPLKSSGTHICFPDSNKYHLYKAIVMALFGSEFRMTTRIHNGSQLECIYGLSTYGINIYDIPLTHTGTIKTERSAAFFKTRRSIDSFRKQQVIEQQNQQQQQQQQSNHFSFSSSSSSSSSSNAVTLGNNTNSNTTSSSLNRKTTSKKKSNNNKSNSNNSNSIITFVSDDPPGMECPGQNYVIYGFKRASDYPTNIMFREQIRIKLLEAESKYNINDHTAPASSSSRLCSSYKIYLDSIINGLLNQFRLCDYDKKHCWYVPITDSIEIRKKVTQAIRDERKRIINQNKIMRMQNGINSCSENGATTETTTTKHQGTVSSSSATATTKRSISSRGGGGGGNFSFSSYNDNNHSSSGKNNHSNYNNDVFEDSSMMGVDAKRLKKACVGKQHHNNGYGNGHGNNNNSNNNNNDDGSSSSLFACWDVGVGSGCI